MGKQYKIVVFVPFTHADELREVMGSTGAGVIGNYSHCTFSTRGIGRFKPMIGAHPTISEVDKLEAVEEERIEAVCPEENLQAVLKAINNAHPYEEPATDVYLLEQI